MSTKGGYFVADAAIPGCNFALKQTTMPAEQAGIFLILTYENNHSDYHQRAEEDYLPGKPGRGTGCVWQKKEIGQYLMEKVGNRNKSALVFLFVNHLFDPECIGKHYIQCPRLAAGLAFQKRRCYLQ